MKRSLAIGLFAAVAAVQLAVAARMIWIQESTLRQGAVYRFRTEPVDPADPFRGRYVQLGFAAQRVACNDESSEAAAPVACPDARNWHKGDWLYASLATDAEGFARITRLDSVPPNAVDYLRVRADQVYSYAVSLQLPFDRYYLDEQHAPEAERAYRQRSRRRRGERVEAWVSVRVRSPHAVLEELYLDGKPVRQFLVEWEKHSQ